MTINSHQDHTASYYAATANKQTVYEQLNGHKKLMSVLLALVLPVSQQPFIWLREAIKFMF
ncbi:MAG: hypothetical protein CM15mP51_00490 [Porticoccaceae bacterium]|nr:MAG: hypothetical protein CM15mP51_00490 [Porticoccaceae bacterium]